MIVEKLEQQISFVVRKYHLRLSPGLELDCGLTLTQGLRLDLVTRAGDGSSGDLTLIRDDCEIGGTAVYLKSYQNWYLSSFGVRAIIIQIYHFLIDLKSKLIAF